MNVAADCWILKWNETLVGFCAVLPQPTGTANYCKRIHRLVILPDYQGLGIGTRFLEALCEVYINRGFKVYIRSAHIKLAQHWSKSKLWRPTPHNGEKSPVSKGKINNEKQNPYIMKRDAYSYEYIGSEFNSKPKIDIIADELNENINIDGIRKYLIESRKNHYVRVIHNSVKNESKLNIICKELGIRTDLLYIHGKIVKKYRNKSKIVSIDENGKNIIYAKVI